MPSFADEYVDESAVRVPHAPILEDDRGILEPGPEPLFVPEPAGSPTIPSVPAAPGHPETTVRPRRHATNYGNQVAQFGTAFKAVRTSLMLLVAALVPGGRAFGSPVLSLDNTAAGNYVPACVSCAT